VPRALLSFAAGSIGHHHAEAIDSWVQWFQGALATTACTVVKTSPSCLHTVEVQDAAPRGRCSMSV
jgi:hypothetical protein